MYRNAGVLREWGATVAVIARLHVYQGNFQVALQLCSELNKIGQDAGDPQLNVWGLTTQAAVWCCVGSLQAAEANDHAFALGLAVPLGREDRDLPQIRHRVLEQLQPLAGQLTRLVAEAGQIPAGSGQARNEALFLGVIDREEHDGHKARRLFHGW